MSEPNPDFTAEEQLLNAATRGDAYRVRVLLTAGAVAADARNQKSAQTALICAAMNGRDEVVRLLLDAGASAEAKDVFGLTALEWAVRRNFTETERLLRNAAPTARPANRETNYVASRAGSARAAETEAPLIKQSAAAAATGPKTPRLAEAGPTSTTTTPRAGVVDVPEESAIKHCPRCRTSYKSSLLFYCSYDAAPLVDGAAAAPPLIPGRFAAGSKSQTRVTTFCLSFVLIYLLYPGGATTGPSSAGPFRSREAQAGRHLLDVDAPLPYLREGNPAMQFEALRQFVIAGAGFDFLAKCGDMFRARAAKSSKPGVSFLSRHKSGDAFDYNQEDSRVLIVREQMEGSTYWRTYLICQKQDGTQGIKTTLRTDNAGQLSAYVFDFTAAAEKLGWERIPARAGWEREPNNKEYWHYEMTEGLSFDFAAALVNPEPRRKGVRSRSVSPKAKR